MTLLLFVVAFFCFAILVQFGNHCASASCITADHVAGGQCVPMHQCQRISFMLASWSSPYPRHVQDYLERSHCGSVANDNYVCCAVSNLRSTAVSAGGSGSSWHRHQPNYYEPVGVELGYAYPNVQLNYPNPNTGTGYTYAQHGYGNAPHPYSSYPNRQIVFPNSQGPAHGYPSAPNGYANNPNDYSRLGNTNSGYPYGSHHTPQTTYAAVSYGEQLLNAMQCGAYTRDRISNGETVRIYEFPWMALLEYEGPKTRKRFQCSGSLITNRYVLTAAHCAATSYELIGVRLGEHNLNTEHDCERSYNNYDECSPPYEDIGVEQILTHPHYSAQSVTHDVALLRLNRVVVFQRHIQPICLPRPGSAVPHQLTITGWGATEKGYASSVLMKASVTLHTNEHCRAVFTRSPHIGEEQHICAGGEYGRSTCRGDSGGPLLAAVHHQDHIRYTQFGISSGGARTCGSQRNLPALYTRLSTYMPWIVANLRP